MAKDNIPAETTIITLTGAVCDLEFESFYGLNSDNNHSNFISIPGSDPPVIFRLEPESSQLLEKCASRKGLQAFPPVSYKMFKEIHALQKSYDADTSHNAELKIHSKDGDYNIKICSVCEILSGEKISIQIDKQYWLRKKMATSNNPFEKLISLIFLNIFNNSQNIPEAYKPFSNFFTSWRSWSEEVTSSFLETCLGADPGAELVDSLHCRGYSSRVLLYRMMQVTENISLLYKIFCTFVCKT